MTLRIAVTADPYLPVPPTHYGGIERVIAFLVAGLVERGHDVTLVAHPESATPARLVPYGSHPHVGTIARAIELGQVGGWIWRHRRQLDVVHSFGRLAALAPVLTSRGLAKVQTYQRAEVPWTSVRRASHLAGQSLAFTACSTSVYRSGLDAPHGPQGEASRQKPMPRWTTVFNGVDVDRYQAVWRVEGHAPLMFLGRIEPIKGTHHAIAIARQAGRKLVIAGVHAESGPHADYFAREIRPHIDGDRVVYVGPVDDRLKGEWLGRAAALLMPIEWDEPFGIVMAEAFACGTPVIGFRRGSVPEVVREGINGYIVNCVADAANAVSALDRLDRSAIRADCEKRFGAGVIVDRYEDLYVEIYDRVRGRTRAEAMLRAS